MNRTVWLAALLLLAILAIVGVVGVTGPVRVESVTNTQEPTATAAPIDNDAGSLDSLLDGLHVEHLMKHGR